MKGYTQLLQKRYRCILRLKHSVVIFIIKFSPCGSTSTYQFRKKI